MSSPTSSAQDVALVVNVRGGARICVPPTLDQMTSYILLEQEDWFEDEIRFVRRWLEPGMRVVDAGASFGLYSMAAARAAPAGTAASNHDPRAAGARARGANRAEPSAATSFCMPAASPRARRGNRAARPWRSARAGA